MNKNYEILSESLLFESKLDVLTSQAKKLQDALEKKKPIPQSILMLIKNKDKVEKSLESGGIMKSINALVPMSQRMVVKLQNEDAHRAIAATAVLLSKIKKTNPKTELITLGAEIKKVITKAGSTGRLILMIVLLKLLRVAIVAFVPGALIAPVVLSLLALVIIYIVVAVIKSKQQQKKVPA